MRTEDVPLDIKGIFERKKVSYHKFDIARMRNLCKIFIEYILEYEKNKTKEKGSISLESREAW